MEKIIYIYKKRRKMSRFRRYQFQKKEITFLGYPVCSYEIRLGQEEGLFPAVKKLNKLLQKKEMLKDMITSGKTFLFYSWKECEYPPELLTAFYKEQVETQERVRKAQQLILLDGIGESNVTFVSQICSSFNYVTIITKAPYKWSELIKQAYEEYGLSMRCVTDGKELTFLKKQTLILDMGGSLAKCWRNYPEDSIYMDLRESPEKYRWISVKCSKIPYISIRNTLDTALTDGV